MYLTGDWRKLRGMLSKGQKVVDEVNDSIRESAQEIANLAMAEIPFGSVPNTEKTAKNKGMNAPLLETGGFKDGGIVVDDKIALRDAGAYKSYFLIHGDPNQHTPRGLSYEKLLAIAEGDITITGFHDSEIPQRPILTMAFDRHSASMQSFIITKFKNSLWEDVY